MIRRFDERSLGAPFPCAGRDQLADHFPDDLRALRDDRVAQRAIDGPNHSAGKPISAVANRTESWPPCSLARLHRLFLPRVAYAFRASGGTPLFVLPYCEAVTVGQDEDPPANVAAADRTCLKADR